jgi:hypothetical protein
MYRKMDPMERQPYPGTPRWVKVSGLLAVAFVVVFAIVHLAGGGFRNHGGHQAPAAATPESAR